MTLRALAAITGFTLIVGVGAASAQQSDTVIVTAGRTEQLLINAPAATTVISDVAIARTPGDDFGDLLRNVPGVNIAQTSARDINMTARGATNALANSQLVLLDGRSVYLDFFGFVMWDLLPIQASEIERIEVVRGPGSAVWGANAMSGVTNVITRRPADIEGTRIVLGTPYANLVHARGDDDFAFKIAAGYFDESAYDRPKGTIPGSNPPQQYPDFENEGTTQKRVNVRFDWGIEDGYIAVGAGSARTSGILHTGLGPFDVRSDSELSHLQADWHKGTAHVGVSVQSFDSGGNSLLTLAANGLPLGFDFTAETYIVDASNTNVVGGRHVVTYGGNIKRHDFNLDIAPRADNKDEWGIFVQDEILLGDRLRWLIGVRYDDIDPLSNGVLTPRTSLLYSLAPDHTLRLSYNEAFRTPSSINSFLDVSILQPLAPGIGVSADAFGNALLTEERLEAYEIGYTGFLANGMSVSASIYRNDKRDSIDFFVSDVYGPANLPMPGPLLPPALIPCFAVAPGSSPACPNGGLAGLVPSGFSYRNIGRTVDRGAEFALEQDRGDWYWWFNTSWQDDPDIRGASADEINRAPEWRANVGLGQDSGRFFWNTIVNYQSESYWADVLYARAATEAFTQVNASVGWRLRDENMTFSLIGQNVFDRRLQQHIFGDIIERRLDAQFSYQF
jgi:outer membrane receptor protein involved in Fe transport